MDKTYQTEFRRTFIFSSLPEPLKPASSHLQVFDNYIENTRFRLRSIRVPEEKKWTHLLEQRFPLSVENLSTWKISRTYLDVAENNCFSMFKGREIRKNRYYFEWNESQCELDIYLGDLWGLNLMNVHFDSIEEMNEFELPPIVVFEVTNYQFFTGEHLVNKTFEGVRKKIESLSLKTEK